MTATTPRIVDLSHPVEAGMTTHPGLPGPEIGDHLSRDASRANYAPGVEFQIGWIRMVANTGTYLDTPFHRYPDGTDLAAADLHRMADLPAVVVDVTHTAADPARRAVTPADLAGIDLDGLAGKAVLFHTSWDRHWRTAHYGDATHPFLATATVEALVAAGVALVGTDTVNIDDLGDRARPAHTGLLGAGVLVVEHMTGLGRLPAEGARFHAVPAPVVGMGTFPVRAYAVLS